MRQALELFFSDPVGQAFLLLLALTIADVATGIFAAIRDGTFAMSVVAAFLRKHVLGRAAPVLLLLFLGFYAHVEALTGLGLVSAAAYTLELMASIRGNISPPSDDVTAEHKAAAKINPVPTD